MSKTIVIETIESKGDHQKAIEKLRQLISANDPNDNAEIRLLGSHIEDYEKTHYPIPPCNPVDLIKTSMSQRGLDQKGLERKVGFSLTDIFNDPTKFENLTIRQVKKISDACNVSLETMTATL